MATSIYVGNLSYETTEDQIRDLFAQHGTVHSAKVITDRYTGKSRGFAFVEMDPEEADTAIEATNNQELDGRVLRVNKAKPKRERPDRRW